MSYRTETCDLGECISAQLQHDEGTPYAIVLVNSFGDELELRAENLSALETWVRGLQQEGKFPC